MYCCSTTGSCRPLSSVSNTCRNTKLSAVILKFGSHCVRDLAPLCAAVCPVVRQGTMPILCLKHLQSACQSFGYTSHTRVRPALLHGLPAVRRQTLPHCTGLFAALLQPLLWEASASHACPPVILRGALCRDWGQHH